MKLKPTMVGLAATLLSFSAFAADDSEMGAGAKTQSQTMEQQQSQSQQSEHKQVVSEVQQKLNEEGYDSGPVDGILGPKTKDAVRNYQQAKNIQPTGSLDSQTLSELGFSESDIAAFEEAQQQEMQRGGGGGGQGGGGQGGGGQGGGGGGAMGGGGGGQGGGGQGGGGGGGM